MLTLHLEAASLEELRAKAILALDLRITTAAQAEVRIADLTAPEITPAPKPVEPVEPVKKRRAHRRVRPVETPVAAPVAVLEPVEEPLVEDRMPDADIGSFTAIDVDADDRPVDPAEMISTANANENALDKFALEKLKAEVVASLAGRFAAGQVKSIRAVLTKYGNGAKSYPEIDASLFPAISAALERGEAA
jgi:hypothetical protein